MRKKSIKILSLLLTLALVLGLMPGMGMIAHADDIPSVTITPAGAGNVNFEKSGQDLKFTATANPGYEFDYWSYQQYSSLYSTWENETRTSNPDQWGYYYDEHSPSAGNFKDLTAHFKANSATVTYKPGAEATGEDQTVTVTKDEQGKLTHNIQKYEDKFTAPEGKHFDHWDDGKGNTYKYGDTVTLTEDITLTAIWVDNSQDSGTQPQRRGGGLSGDLVFGFPGADDGWEYIGGGMPQRAYRLSFAPMQGGSAYFLLTSGENGETMNVYPQTTVRVVPTPAPGYRLASIVWSMIDGSASYDITESQTFVMPAMDAVVYVTFQPIA